MKRISERKCLRKDFERQEPFSDSREVDLEMIDDRIMKVKKYGYSIVIFR